MFFGEFLNLGGVFRDSFRTEVLVLPPWRTRLSGGVMPKPKDRRIIGQDVVFPICLKVDLREPRTRVGIC